MENNTSERILIVDDEKPIQKILNDFLSLEGYRISVADDAENAMEILKKLEFDMVITDLKLPGKNGLELLDFVQNINPDIISIIMTGYGTVESAIQAMKKGAFDYILKPFKINELIYIVKRGLENKRLRQENIRLKEIIALYDVSEELNTSLHINSVLSLIMTTILKTANADHVSIFLKDDSGNFQPRIESSIETLKNFKDTGILNIPLLISKFKLKEAILLNHHELNSIFLSRNQNINCFLSLPLLTKNDIIGFLNVYSLDKSKSFKEGQRKILSILAGRAAQAIENAELFQKQQNTFKQTIKSFAIAMEEKDKYTQGHSERVSKYAKLIAEGCCLEENIIELIEQAALLHDIGKLGIDSSKINKPDKLSPEESFMFRKHPIIGKNILQPISFLADFLPIIYYHHERYDGTGYPDGLKGEKIPYGARILSIADSYDAMTTDRPYRKALSKVEAREELIKNKNSQFDGDLVEIFLKQLEKITSI